MKYNFRYHSTLTRRIKCPIITKEIYFLIKGCHLGRFCWAIMMEHNSETSIGKPSAEAKGMISILNRVIILKQTQKSGSEIQSIKALYWITKLGWKAQRSHVRRKENFKVKIWSDYSRLTKWIAIREERKKKMPKRRTSPEIWGLFLYQIMDYVLDHTWWCIIYL